MGTEHVSSVPFLGVPDRQPPAKALGEAELLSFAETPSGGQSD